MGVVRNLGIGTEKSAKTYWSTTEEKQTLFEKLWPVAWKK